MGVVKYIADQFAKPTGVGGQLSTWVMNRMNRPMYKACCKTIQEHSPQRVLDIGFGNGYVLQFLSKANPTIQLYGIDISNDAMRMAQRRLGVNARLSIGSATDLVFESKFFDAIYTINTIYFWNDPAKGLSEIQRTLGEGGVFINVCYTKQWLDKLKYTNFGFKKMNREDLLKLHREAGFSSVQWIEIEVGKSFYILCER